jgi:excisionase family DNA binding protein
VSMPLTTEANFEDLWTVAQAMKFLGVKKTWLYEACGKGEVPHVRLGSSIRFEPEQLRAYVKAQRHGPGALVVAPVIPIGGRR